MVYIFNITLANLWRLDGIGQEYTENSTEANAIVSASCSVVLLRGHKEYHAI